MRVIVSDASCLIDLKKGKPLRAVCGLAYQIVVPQPLFDDEWLSLTRRDKEMMVRAGLEVSVLPGELVLNAQSWAGTEPALSIHDCFA